MKTLPYIKASFVILRYYANSLIWDRKCNSMLIYRGDCGIFEFDYCGYGFSSGKTNETNFHKDIMTAYHFLAKNL